MPGPPSRRQFAELQGALARIDRINAYGYTSQEHHAQHAMRAVCFVPVVMLPPPAPPSLLWFPLPSNVNANSSPASIELSQL
eukprot:5815798-Pyramimonas_sp.AAC.1